MPADDLEAEVRRHNEQKLKEHLERVRASGGKPAPTPPRQQPATPKGFQADWAAWKKAFFDRVIERDEGPLPIPPVVQEQSDYALLGVKPGTPFPEVRKAFHKLAMQHHPDQGGDIDQFRTLMEAFDRIEKQQAQ